MENSEEFAECTLFVGDLNRDVSKEDLYNLFEMVGEVQEAVVKCSNVTGQPMGYGFVRMATKEDADHALQTLVGMNLKGRSIRVGRAERNCRLIVKNLDRSVRFEDLLHIFLPYGSLQMYDSGQEVSVNGFCARILHFVRRADAERAKRDLHMQIFHGRPMHVEWYRHTPGDSESGEGGTPSRNEPVVSVHVRFMTVEHDIKVDEHMLYHVFKKYGEVTKISIKAMIHDKETNLCRGYAFVHFSPNLDGCQSALEAAASMDDVMFNGVHFFSKPSQNFHRAQEELIRQENHQHLQQSTHNHIPYQQTSAPSRRYQDPPIGMGRMPRQLPPRLSYPSSGSGQTPTPYHSLQRSFDEGPRGHPRIMQYQHDPPSGSFSPALYLTKPPYYQDFFSEGEGGIGLYRGQSGMGVFGGPGGAGWIGSSNGYQRSTDFGNEDFLYLPPHQTGRNGLGMNDFRRDPRGEPRIPPRHDGSPYTIHTGDFGTNTQVYGSGSKEIFPQEYYEQAISPPSCYDLPLRGVALTSVTADAGTSGSYHTQTSQVQAESGLNIEASAFLPSSVTANRPAGTGRPSHLTHIIPLSQTENHGYPTHSLYYGSHSEHNQSQVPLNGIGQRKRETDRQALCPPSIALSLSSENSRIVQSQHTQYPLSESETQSTTNHGHDPADRVDPTISTGPGHRHSLGKSPGTVNGLPDLDRLLQHDHAPMSSETPLDPLED